MYPELSSKKRKDGWFDPILEPDQMGKLRGVFCRECGGHFSSAGAFDMHRNRKRFVCLTPEQMRDKGMVFRAERGMWITEEFDATGIFTSKVGKK